MKESPAELNTIELLLACLKLEGDRQEGAGLEQATPEGWESVFQLARQRGVAPLLYGRVRREQAGLGVPGNVQEKLRNTYLTCVRDNLRLYNEVGEYLGALNKAKIPVIPLKGIYLAEKVYGNIGWRAMVDVDLLIQRQDLRRAVEVAQNQGYQPGYAFEVEQECLVMHHMPALHKQDSPHLELHWNLAPPSTPFKIDIEEVWQAAQPGRLAGAEVLEMSAEDLLLHLCLHAAYLDYFSSGLRPICDIAWTIEHNQKKLDWEKLAEQAQRWGAERNLYLALRITQRLMGVAIPGGHLESNQPDGYDTQFEEWGIRQIFKPSEVGGKLAQVWAPQPWLRRGKRFLQSLFPAGHEIRQSYPELAHGLSWIMAYMRHLEAIVERNSGRVWKLLTGEPHMTAEMRQREAINRLVEWQGCESLAQGVNSSPERSM